MEHLDAALLALTRLAGTGRQEAQDLPLPRLVRLLKTLHRLRTDPS